MNKVVVLSSAFVLCDGYWLTHEYLLTAWCVNVSFVEREECFYLWAATLKIRCSKLGVIIPRVNEYAHVEIYECRKE